MTLIERNKKIAQLSTELAWAKLKVFTLESELAKVRQEYKDEQMFAEGSLYEQMFGCTM